VQLAYQIGIRGAAAAVYCGRPCRQLGSSKPMADLSCEHALEGKGDFCASGYLSIEPLNSNLLRLCEAQFPSVPSQVACLLHDLMQIGDDLMLGWHNIAPKQSSAGDLKRNCLFALALHRCEFVAEKTSERHFV
jgi:hypothetical protein